MMSSVYDEVIVQPYDESDEIDYSFSKLPVRERRKLFMKADMPEMGQTATLPRMQSYRGGSRFESSASCKDWGTPIRRSLAPKVRTLPRPTSIHEGQRVTSRTFEMTPIRQAPKRYEATSQPLQYKKSLDSTPSLIVYPSSAKPSSSKVQTRSQCSTTLWVNETPASSMSAGAFIEPTEREFTRTGFQSVRSPLRVRVYNSDNPTVSPGYHHVSPTWSQSSTFYPAYPAYRKRPNDRAIHVQRVMPNAAPPPPLQVHRSQIVHSPPVHAPLTLKKSHPLLQQASAQKSVVLYPKMVTRPLVQHSFGQPEDHIRMATNPHTRASYQRSHSQNMSSRSRAIKQQASPSELSHGVSEF